MTSHLIKSKSKGEGNF